VKDIGTRTTTKVYNSCFHNSYLSCSIYLYRTYTSIIVISEHTPNEINVMELRNTETEIQSLTEFYVTLQARSIRNSNGTINVQLPPIVRVRDTSTVPSTMKPDTDSLDSTRDSSHSDRNSTNQSAATRSDTATAIEIQNDLIHFQQRMRSVQSVITKFIQRLHQVDPITQQPRYGTQTKQRVQHIIHAYDALVQVYNIIFTPPITVSQVVTSESSQAQVDTTMKDSDLITVITNLADQERIEHEEQLRLQRQQELLLEEAQQNAILEQQRQHEAATAMTLQRERTQFQQQTEQFLETRRQLQAEHDRQARLDRTWIDSIPNRNSLLGVQEQLHIFKSSCQQHQQQNASTTTFGTSIQALHTVFAQIVSHPDEERYRRIRRNHPQFVQDIGQFTGGTEVLICAGFQLGMVDGTIPAYICKEPNVETDLDGWSNWFNLLKGTLDLIEKEMMQ
jgi:PUB domain